MRFGSCLLLSAALLLAVLLVTAPSAAAVNQLPLPWFVMFEGTKDDTPSYAVADGDGNIYLVGFTKSYSTSDYSDAFIAKFSYDLMYYQNEWFKAMGGSKTDQFSEATFSDGKIYAVGYTFDEAASRARILLAVFNEDGNPLLVKSIGGDAHYYGSAIAVDDSGNIYVGGTTTLDSARDAFIAKLDSSGNLLWVKVFGGSGIDEVKAIAISPSGQVYAVGRTTSFQTGAFSSWEIMIVKLTPAGSLEWLKVVETSDGACASSILFVDSTIIVGGTYLMKLDVDGNILQAVELLVDDGGGQNHVSPSILGMKGSAIYLAGTIYDSKSKICIIKVDEDLTPIEASLAELSGDFNELSNNPGVVHDGRVFVAGCAYIEDYGHGFAGLFEVDLELAFEGELQWFSPSGNEYPEITIHRAVSVDTNSQSLSSTAETPTLSDVSLSANTIDPSTYVRSYDPPVAAAFVGNVNSITIRIRPGWNLFSLPVDTLNRSIANIFGELAENIHAYMWDPFFKHYLEVSHMEMGKGYWVYYGGSTPADVELAGISYESINTSVAAGWNLIGSLDVPSMPYVIDGDMFKYIYLWRSGRYVPSTYAEPGEGYWLLAYEDSLLEIIPAPPPPP